MPLTRRQFLRTAAATPALVPALMRAQQPSNQPRVFRHGVASGDPATDRVVLWTRVTPPATVTGALTVRWIVGTDAMLTRRVAGGNVATSAARDYTVKVDAGGLEPGRTYYYAFDTAGERSPIGRTKTLPSGAVNRLRLASISCANYPAGFFNVYRALANRADLDAVIHLGDYIYEFANGEYGDGRALMRLPQPLGETITLQDYRQRYAIYRTDPDLQEAHRQHPFIAVWDDHELANDAWSGGAANHDPDGREGSWATRKAAATRAYLEWMPIREAAGQAFRLYRRVSFGTLADLVMLDTRSLRDRQVAADNLTALADSQRHLLGAAQEAWMYESLRASQGAGVTWRLLGQQVMFSRIAQPGRMAQNPDGWEGYLAERERVLEFVQRERMRNLVILTGDMHSAWGFDVPRDPWSPARQTALASLAVELVAPAISSPSLFSDEQARTVVPALRQALPHLRFLDGRDRGYILLDITASQLRAEFYLVPSVLARSDRERLATALVCEAGSARLVTA